MNLTMKKISIAEAHRRLLAKVRERADYRPAVAFLQALAAKKKGGLRGA